jgi:hypothetical protein
MQQLPADAAQGPREQKQKKEGPLAPVSGSCNLLFVLTRTFAYKSGMPKLQGSAEKATLTDGWEEEGGGLGSSREEGTTERRQPRPGAKGSPSSRKGSRHKPTTTNTPG